MAVAERRTEDAAGTAAPAPPPLATRLWSAAFLAAVGLLGSALWLFATSDAVNGFADGFARTRAPGTVTVQAHPGTYYVYVEGVDAGTLEDLALEVVDPKGEVVPVREASRGVVDYDHDGMMGHVVGEFRVDTLGQYRVSATGSLDPYGDFAVGDRSVASWMRPHLIGITALLVVNLGGSLLLVVVTVVQHRRSRSG